MRVSSEKSCIRMAERAVALAGGTLGQFVPLKAADCEAIYRLAL